MHFLIQKLIVIRLVLIVSLVFIFSACGGTSAGGGNDPKKDTAAPIITLNGTATLELEQGTDYVEQGATANDNTDGDISANITVTGSVDVNTIGSYTVTYNVSDAAGNLAAEVIRTVTVTPIPTINSYVGWSFKDEQSCAFGAWVDCQIDFSIANLTDFESWVLEFRTAGSKDDDYNEGFTIGEMGNSQALIATQTDTRDPGGSRRTEAKVALIPVGDYRVTFNLFVAAVPDSFDTTISQIKCGSGKPPINIKMTDGGGVRIQSGGNTPLSDTAGYLLEGWHFVEYTIENSKKELSLTIDGNILDIDNSESITDCSDIEGAGNDYYLKIGLYENDIPPGYRIAYENLTLNQL